ncbi:hypothetical protein CYMTET_10367 [Cymbomonas tetramitiformis]|uniref:Glycosyltransferase 2-like domain-containing protein n=1 Tax=Cymbomonas tetramitiformis TaxID=36881 RepID=A0AAE0LE88_9CHLO|nr:hypothetical protein CYMTET_10367 [Cymbomonas tetramitiformis]
MWPWIGTTRFQGAVLRSAPRYQMQMPAGTRGVRAWVRPPQVGGVAEMILPEDQERVLISPDQKALAKKIIHVIKNGLRPARPKLLPTVDKTWVVWHHILIYQTKHMDAKTLQQYERPLVSVCIVTFNNPSTLKQAIISIEQQEYSNVEVVVVDDGSTQTDAMHYLEELDMQFKEKGWIFRRQENRGPGAARNYGSNLARGDWLMFMDDDNYAKPHEIATFVSVAFHTHADVLTCSNDYFYGNDPPSPDRNPTGRWVPLGAATTVGMFQNMYGDTNAMIKKDVFHKLGGFPEDFGYALEDWELFSKAVLGGYNLQTIPDPLYWYRLRDTSHSRVTAKHGNPARTIRPYLKKIPQNLHHLVLFAQGMKDSHDIAHVELEFEQEALREMRKMLKALASTLNTLCKDGKLPEHSRNMLLNSQFQASKQQSQTATCPQPSPPPCSACHAAPQGALLCAAAHAPRSRRRATQGLEALLCGASPRRSSCAGSSVRHDGADEVGGVSSSAAHGWKPYASGYLHDASGGRIGYGSVDSFAIKMANSDWRDARGATQQVMLNQESPSAVVVSGWSKAEKVSGSMDSGYAIYIDIAFQDGTKLWGYTISFEVGTHGWQFKAGVIDPEVAIQSLQLYTMFRWHSGTVWFDDLAVNMLTEGLCDYTQLTLEGLGHSTELSHSHQ